MGTAELPMEVIHMLASPNMRLHHREWHFVRARWHVLTNEQKEDYTSRHMNPPRLDPRSRPTDAVPAPARDTGSGIDFIFMHRMMIKDVNEKLAQIGDENYPKIESWTEIPWNHNDSDWPMPAVWHPMVANAKSQATTDHWKREVETKYDNLEWYKGKNFDDVASEIENGIHNWFHMHWSDTPWFRDNPGQDENDVRNDFLGSTYSSHVNKTFWKFHGWIDDRVEIWQEANGEIVDFSDAWIGGEHGHNGHHGHHAEMAPTAMDEVILALEQDFDKDFFNTIS